MHVRVFVYIYMPEPFVRILPLLLLPLVLLLLLLLLYEAFTSLPTHSLAHKVECAQGTMVILISAGRYNVISQTSEYDNLAMNWTFSNKLNWPFLNLKSKPVACDVGGYIREEKELERVLGLKPKEEGENIFEMSSLAFYSNVLQT